MRRRNLTLGEAGGNIPVPEQRQATSAMPEGDRHYSAEDMNAYVRKVQSHAEEQHKKYIESLGKAIQENDRLRKQLSKVGAAHAKYASSNKSAACTLM